MPQFGLPPAQMRQLHTKNEKSISSRALLCPSQESTRHCSTHELTPNHHRLSWMVYGEPGPGKSWLYHVLADFLDMLSFKNGVQYAFCSGSRKRACSIGGYTLHHLVGLGWHTSSTSSVSESLRVPCQTTLRWLFIDEINCSIPVCMPRERHACAPTLKR